MLALALYSHAAYEEVMRCLVEGLGWAHRGRRGRRSWPYWHVPGASALGEARERLGPEPLKVPAHPLVGGWAPDLPLQSDRGDTRLAMLLHHARPVLLDLSPDGWLAATAAGWTERVQITAARSDQPLDGILVRPDGYVAWAAAAGDRDTDGLRHALQTWFGVAG